MIELKATQQTGPPPKYQAPMRRTMQFWITDEQKAWLLEHKGPDQSMADVLRQLIDRAMAREAKIKR